MSYPLALTVNGVAHSLAVDGGRTLLSVLRDDLGLTGAKEGCDDSECGACMVLLERAPGELLLVPRAAGRPPRGDDR